ncbi:MAG: 4-hydroxy-tetrahydrodipicolinate reductase [Actinomycetota bacterium]
MIRVGVVGATGRMGREVCRAVDADPDLALVAAVSHSAPGSSLADAIGLETEAGAVVLVDRLDDMLDADIDVLVDFTSPPYASDHIAWGIANGAHVVVGTTGFEIDDAWREAPVGVVVAPNFAIGAVLLMRFAEQAARHLPSAEVIELHHDRKVDSPSGTALLTARRIAAARNDRPADVGGDDAHPGARGADVDGVRVHSVRLPGLVAHEEVVFGGEGQTLTLRHDSTDRTSFMPGVLLAIKAAPSRPGLTVGLEALLEQG